MDDDDETCDCDECGLLMCELCNECHACDDEVWED